MTVFGAVIPFVDHCAIEEVGLVEGRTRLRMRVGPEHMNNIGIVHGGAIATLIDVALGTAGRTHSGVPVMTVDMHVSFMAPGRGPVLLGEGRVVGGGRSLLFCEGEVRDEAGVLVAKASGVMKPVRPKPPGSPEVNPPA